jgi:hypothetical protein
VKVYFTASIAGKKQYLAQYEQIVRILKGLGHEVIAEHILDHTESKIRLETKDERVAFHKKLERWIKGAECVVVEASFPSISVGYEISLALHSHKPVLMLYADGDPPSLLDNCHEDKVVCERYANGDLKQIIEGFLDYISGRPESRFTFYITPEIMAHLDDVARNKHVPKAVYVRQLIEREMGQ